MNIVFISNYLNHHQIAFCQAIIDNLDGSFNFIQIEDMDPERIKMGWGVNLEDYPYAVNYKENPVAAKKLILDSDVAIFGGVDDEEYISERLEKGKIVVRYSERIYKEGQWKFISPKGLKKKYHDHIRYRNKPVYLLCAGAYVASDFSLIHAYKGKMYSWGYFPKVFEYDNLNELRENNDKLELLWCGRMIDWKHPESIYLAAKCLQKAGIDFNFTVIADGPLKNEICSKTENLGLSGYIDFKSFVEPLEVRNYMRKADIFLFTSDFKEGWGAVLNESMNSGCAVIASAGIGAVPYLLKHEKNGMVYKTGDFNEMNSYLLRLAKDKSLRYQMGNNAYNTMISKWNPEKAGHLFVNFARSIYGEFSFAAIDGPLSVAPIISPKKGYYYTREN